MLSKQELINKLSDLKPHLKKEYGVKEIGIFGSYAKDNPNEESDIDILVSFDKQVGWSFFSLELFLEEVFQKKIDLVTPNALKEQIKDSIMNGVNYI